MRDKTRIIIGKGAQDDGREELPLDNSQNPIGVRRIEQRMRKADREELIRSNAGIATFAVNHVVKTSLLLVPERLPEPFAHAGGTRSECFIERLNDAQRVVPERVDL